MYKLVIVEDELDVRCRIVDMVGKTRRKFEITAIYSTGIDAYEGFMADDPDLILTDIMIPHMDGIELAKAVREIDPFVKIVFITGYFEFEYAKEAANLGVLGFLNKPVSPDEIEAILLKAEKALDEEYELTQNKRELEKMTEHIIISDKEADGKIKQLMDYFDENYCSPDISLGLMAEDLNFSVSYISQLLKQRLDSSFVKILTAKRMEKAKILLRDPGLKIVDVSEQLGYSNSYYFSHCFKKYTGQSPREFKMGGAK